MKYFLFKLYELLLVHLHDLTFLISFQQLEGNVIRRNE